MKIICLVKFVPDVDSFEYDFERNILIRDSVRLQLNPDDICAVAFALKVKAQRPESFIEAVTMAPARVAPNMEDLMRIGVDRCTVISDRLYAGSDTFATSKVLARYLETREYDVILTGTHAIDGDTSHIPPQLGACLGLDQMSGIVSIDEMDGQKAVFSVDTEEERTTYEAALPAILSLTRDSGYKLPYPKREALERDFSESISFVDNSALAFFEGEAGLSGSKTRVVGTYTKSFEKKDRLVVKADDEGVETVFSYLEKNGFI